MQPEWMRLEDLVTIDKEKRFMARPPPPTTTYDDLTPVQRWAVDLGSELGQKKNGRILYLCGKAGSGKTEVALHICQKMEVNLDQVYGTRQLVQINSANCT